MALSTAPKDLVDRLAAHRTIGAAPRAELEWLAAHGTLQQMEAGEVVSAKDRPVEQMYILLAGRVAIFVDRGSGPRKAMEWRAGDVSGILPYSRLVNPPGDALAQEPTTVLAVPREHLREMTRECHDLTAILVHVMLDRARTFTSSDLHDEKLLSLGRLAAGLAHELNNPAAAIERSAARLDDWLDEGERAARALGAAGLGDAQLKAIDEARDACLAERTPGVRSPIEEAEREDAIARWLSGRNLDLSLAEPLAETAVTLEALERLATVVDGPALGPVLRWASSGCAVRTLASEIQEAALRISGLVVAVKGFTHMDQATVAEPVDLAQSLGNTVAVLKAKARGRSAAVVVDLPPALPRVRGFVGELNQIWANLIDNALDAIADGGRVEVRASVEGPGVVVRIVDDGPGIPDEVRERIFEPFFTTKPLGRGTGLGLDIVRRLVRHNDGVIEVDSRPGRTEFRVLLQSADSGVGGGSH
jgi:signal transduction histidine kinase